MTTNSKIFTPLAWEWSFHRFRSVLVPAALGAAVSACSPQYEIDRPGTWKPTGANDVNLQAMVANPLDLQSGAAATTDRGNVAAQAVTRLLTDHRRELLNATVSNVAPISGTSGNDSSGGAGSTPSGGQ